MEKKREKGSLRAASLAGRIRRAMRQLDRETAACAALAERLRTLPTEAEWLLDNRYLAERAAKGAAMELRRGGRLRPPRLCLAFHGAFGILPMRHSIGFANA